MSRLGKKPIQLPDSVKFEIAPSQVTVAGPKGTLSIPYDPKVTIILEDKLIVLSVPESSNKTIKAKHGLFRVLIQNMIIGVTTGFTKDLELVGVGYRTQLKGNSLEFMLGFSHPVVIDPPSGIEFKVDGNTKISISGIDKQLVGHVAANIRSLRKPDPYKGKGVRYAGEYIRKKQGKTVKK
ncbi:MAG: 50S ribosomal protein L6 [Candidatus Margulisbacteria bacterium]|nr:50S ribosomal protein L6 [Candidatus Margulisiibacteriota bacterium]